MPNERERRRGDHLALQTRSSLTAARRTLHANRDGDLNDLIRGTTQLQGDQLACRTGYDVIELGVRHLYLIFCATLYLAPVIPSVFIRILFLTIPKRRPRGKKLTNWRRMETGNKGKKIRSSDTLTFATIERPTERSRFSLAI